MRNFIHDVPASRVVFGEGVSAHVTNEVDLLGGNRVMFISSKYEADLAQPVIDELGSRVATSFNEVVMHVPIEVAQKAVDQAREANVDLLVSLGGGSSTGMAKAIAKESGLPILAIPTTYAGSEMTPIWGLTENSRKTTGRDLKVLPKTVIYDPLLTLGLPADLSAASGMNAMAHLVEALYGPDISPIGYLTAEEGVRALASALPRVVRDPSDIEARSDALYGTWLAGIALGTVTMGVHHKVCHTLGGAYNLPHAQMHSAILSYATAFNESAAPEAMASIKKALTSAGIDAPTAAEGIWNLEQRIGAPTSLSEVGFDLANVDEAVGIIVAGQPKNPRPVDTDGIRELLIAAHDGTRPGAKVS